MCEAAVGGGGRDRLLMKSWESWRSRGGREKQKRTDVIRDRTGGMESHPLAHLTILVSCLFSTLVSSFIFTIIISS